MTAIDTQRGLGKCQALALEGLHSGAGPGYSGSSGNGGDFAGLVAVGTLVGHHLWIMRCEGCLEIDRVM